MQSCNYQRLVHIETNQPVQQLDCKSYNVLRILCSFDLDSRVLGTKRPS